MALLTIKATSLLLIITLVISSYGVVEAGLVAGIGKLINGISKSKSTVPASVFTPTPRPFGGGKVTPTFGPFDSHPWNKRHPVMSEASAKAAAEAAVKKAGENLALKYFGPGGQKGFRWGWKGTKYYLKAAERCEEYHTSLNPHCPPQYVDKLRPGCVVKYCIVVTAINNTVDKTPTSCYNSCDDPIKPQCNDTVTYDGCAILKYG